jgi:hypothetical protein
MLPEASTLTALMPVFGKCASVVEGPAAALPTEINQHPTSSRRVAGMIQSSTRDRGFVQICSDLNC